MEGGGGGGGNSLMRLMEGEVIMELKCRRGPIFFFSRCLPTSPLPCNLYFGVGVERSEGGWVGHMPHCPITYNIVNIDPIHTPMHPYFSLPTTLVLITTSFATTVQRPEFRNRPVPTSSSNFVHQLPFLRYRNNSFNI